MTYEYVFGDCMGIRKDDIYIAVNKCLQPVKKDLGEVDAKVKEISTQLSSIEDRVKKLQEQLTSIEKSVKEKPKVSK